MGAWPDWEIDSGEPLTLTPARGGPDNTPLVREVGGKSGHLDFFSQLPVHPARDNSAAAEPNNCGSFFENHENLGLATFLLDRVGDWGVGGWRLGLLEGVGGGSGVGGGGGWGLPACLGLGWGLLVLGCAPFGVGA